MTTSMSFRPQMEMLEDRLVPSATASVFQLNSDVSRFISDLPNAARTAIQGGLDIARGAATHNQSLYNRGLNEYNSAIREVEADYQQVRSDLSILENYQAGISRLPTFQRMNADVGNLLEGGLIYVYGGVTLNSKVMQNGANLAVNARNDFFAAIGQAAANLFQMGNNSSNNNAGNNGDGAGTITYDENAPY